MPHADLLAKLPDLPRWIYARGALLSGHGTTVGPVSFDPVSAVVLQEDVALVTVIGAPPADVVLAAAAKAEELLAAPEDAARVASALADWTVEPATLHVLREPWQPCTAAPGAARLLPPRSIRTFGALPAELVDELESVERAGVPIAAAFDGRKPVSFCYATSVSETLWDVSVDTLESHRRRGFASRVARFMFDHFARAKRQPVWGAARSNPASALLAEKLGFVPADVLLVFKPPAGELA